jgi:hypothetical protein
MKSSEAAAAIRSVAASFGRGEADVQAMWAALHGNLHDLCADRPLEGNFLDLFNSLERWEAAVGSGREAALVDSRVIALRLSGVP